MKYHHIIAFVGIVLIASGASVPNSEKSYLNIQGCDEPLSWRFGNIDPRFEIDKQTLKNLMGHVGSVWSNSVNRNLLTYSDSGLVELNLIYSEAQKYTEDEQQLSRRMNKMKLYYYSLNTEYEKLSSKHQELMKQYNNKHSEYIEEVEQYNLSITRWHKDMALTGLEKERLDKRKNEIKTIKTKLDRKLDALNAVAKKMNQASAEINSYADQVNEVVYAYKERFGEDKTFHQGFYINDGGNQKINIYQFDDIDNLRLVLAHEVGHALGLRHTENPESVMYYKMENQNVGDLQLTEEDIQAIKKACQNSY